MNKPKACDNCNYTTQDLKYSRDHKIWICSVCNEIAIVGTTSYDTKLLNQSICKLGNMILDEIRKSREAAH